MKTELPQIKDLISQIQHLCLKDAEKLQASIEIHIKKQQNKIVSHFKRFDRPSLEEMAQYFKDTPLSNEIISAVNFRHYKKEDMDNFDYFLNNFKLSGHEKTCIQKFILCSFEDKDFFELCSQKYKYQTNQLICSKYSMIMKEHPEIFISASQKANLKISIEDFNYLILDGNFQLFKDIMESSHFRKFVDLRAFDILLIALEQGGSHAIQYMADHYEIKKDIDKYIVHNGLFSIYHLGRGNIEYINCVIKNFNFDKKLIPEFMDSFSRAHRKPENWQSVLDNFIQTHPELLEVIHEDAKKSTITKFREFATNHIEKILHQKYLHQTLLSKPELGKKAKI